ncbi:hypothetical protein LBMAG12_00070 [Actinomycetes bacterium]|nr:hypothetical protein LBMAG12_00070 [Actinomycetes bacterium]
MRRAILAALVVCLPLLGSACSGDDPMVTTSPPEVQVGQPNPVLPMDINQIPYKPNERVALGNAEISIGIPNVGEDETFSFDVTVTSGSLELFSITPEMFRVYTLDGKSYISDTTPGIEQFGARTLQSKEVYTGTFSVKIPTDSEPVMFLADLSSLGERFVPGAWVFDPNFTSEPVGG